MRRYHFSHLDTTPSAKHLIELENLLNSPEERDTTGYNNQTKMLKCGDILFKYLNETHTPAVYCAGEVLNIQRSTIYGSTDNTLNIWKEILDIIDSCLPVQSYLARIHIGFAIHIWGDNIENDIEDILKTIQSKLEKFDLYFSTIEKPIYLTIATKIGYLVYPKDTGYLESYKPITRYTAISTTGYLNLDYHSTIKRFDKNFYEDIKRNIEIEEKVFKMVKDETFSLLFQPQIDLRTGKVIGAESLSMWSDHGLIGEHTEIYIEIIENSRYIIDFTIASFRKLVSFLKLHKNILPKDFYISFNLSRAIFKWVDFDLVKMITSELASNMHLIPYIQIEITESTYLSEYLSNKVLSSVIALNKLGFGIVIDDFGSGYGSLNIIANNVAKIIKLDKKITEQLCESNENNIFIIGLVHAVKYANLKIIAEGVETQEQEDKLKDLGIFFVQGYKYAKNLKEKEFLDYLEQSKLTTQ